MIFALMFAAPASFATQMRYPNNTMTYAAADYRFSDFIKIGMPISITGGLVTCVPIA